MYMQRKIQYYQNISCVQFEVQIQCNPNPNPSKLFVTTDKLVLKFVWRDKRPRIGQYKTSSEEE